MGSNRVEFSSFLGCFLFIISHAVSLEVGKDPSQFDDRLSVVIYDVNVIIERLFDGIWDILPYVFRYLVSAAPTPCTITSVQMCRLLRGLCDLLGLVLQLCLLRQLRHRGGLAV